MSRRISLPGAEELFRSTGGDGPAVQEPSLRPLPERGSESTASTTLPSATLPSATLRSLPPDDVAQQLVPDEGLGEGPSRRSVSRSRPRAAGDRRPTGRERHEEKITVYVSPSELMDLEQARLTLRGDFGLAVDRGRIVREALAVVLADLEAKGDTSILVRRLLGR